MRPSKAYLRVTFPERPVSAAQYRRLKQIWQCRRRERRPVLAKKRRDGVFLSQFVVKPNISQPDRGHARTNRRQISVVGAAEIALKVRFELPGDGEIRGRIEPFEVNTETRGACLDMKFWRALWSAVG